MLAIDTPIERRAAKAGLVGERVAVNVLRWLQKLFQHPVAVANAGDLLPKLLPPIIGPVVDAICPAGYAASDESWLRMLLTCKHDTAAVPALPDSLAS